MTALHVSTAFSQPSNVASILNAINTMENAPVLLDLGEMIAWPQSVDLWRMERTGQCEMEITVTVLKDGRVLIVMSVRITWLAMR